MTAPCRTARVLFDPFEHVCKMSSVRTALTPHEETLHHTMADRASRWNAAALKIKIKNGIIFRANFYFVEKNYLKN